MQVRPRLIGILTVVYFVVVLCLLMGPYVLRDDGRDDPSPLPANVHTTPTPDPARYPLREDNRWRTPSW